MALGGGEGLEFGHFRQSFILKGCDHLAQGCALRATLGVCRVWESTLKGVASVFSFTVVNRTLVEKTVCTRILASDCGMTVRMRSGGVRLQPFQGWENVGTQTQGCALRATLGVSGAGTNPARVVSDFSFTVVNPNRSGIMARMRSGGVRL